MQMYELHRSFQYLGTLKIWRVGDDLNNMCMSAIWNGCQGARVPGGLGTRWPGCQVAWIPGGQGARWPIYRSRWSGCQVSWMPWGLDDMWPGWLVTCGLGGW